ncbi:MAG: hypothetical protein AB1758_28675 [Candidatus Eremiobacterota bacterium]
MEPIAPGPTSPLTSAPPAGRPKPVLPGEPPPEPQDLAAIQAAEEVAPQKRSHDWAKAAAVGALVVVGAGLLAGCGPAPPPVTQTVTSNLPAAGISVDANHQGDLGVEVLPPGTARIDLHRETRTERDSDGDSHTEDVPYSPVGVYLGNGIFLDTNGNLSLLPERAFEDSDRGAAVGSVEVDGAGLWDNVSVTRDGNRVIVSAPGPANDYTFTHEGNRVQMDGPLWGDVTITREGDHLLVDGPLWGDFHINRSENQVRVTGPAFLGYTITRQGDTLDVDGPLWSDVRIARQGDTIRVDGPAWADMTIRQIGTTTRLEGPGFSYNVTRDGNSVRTDGPAWDDWDIDVR